MAAPVFGLVLFSMFAACFGQLGQDACLQIYSVPKQKVVCDPSQELRDEIDSIQEALIIQTESVDALNTRVDTLDPDKPQELPEELVEKLAQIDELKDIQTRHTLELSGLDEKMATLLLRVDAVEAANREEFIRMLQMQNNLIHTMWKQSNLTIHENYIEKLNESVTQFVIQLQMLEMGLQDTVNLKETQLLNQLSDTAKLGRLELENFKLQHKESLVKYENKLFHAEEKQLSHFNLTLLHGGSLENVAFQLENSMLKQTLFDEHLAKSQDDIAANQESIAKETEERLVLQAQINSLQENYELLATELKSCKEQTEILGGEVAYAKEKVERWEHLTPRALKVHDCEDALRFYYPVSGVYSINPAPALQPFDVYCEMEEQENTGWTVIQRRQDGSVDFFRGWVDYSQGFGDASGELWLGLQKIHQLTNTKLYRLRVDLQDWKGEWSYAEYDEFRVASEDENFSLHVGAYSGDAGDSLTFHNEMPFTTMDRNNDQKDGLCATWCHGAWWYKDCFLSNLNGRYYQKGPYVPETNWGDGVNWKSKFNTYYYSFKTVSMKIKPV